MKNPERGLLSLQVIRPETCSPCGKKIRFGKMAVKCRNCRLVTHLECQKRVVLSCPSSSATGRFPQQVLLMDSWSR